MYFRYCITLFKPQLVSFSQKPWWIETQADWQKYLLEVGLRLPGNEVFKTLFNVDMFEFRLSNVLDRVP